ncbi:MAG TPA: exodeoxyribonuclease V subunit alpha [Solirubrobacteraceae bacterium]|nr:exodeoxyribonuclease V subunit alpha [Solirubrobacteraceae bacterium]
MSVTVPDRDALDPRFAQHASGLLREFNLAGVLTAADVHVARRVAALAGEADETVLLAVALAVRAPRLGHVHVDLAAIRDTAAVDADEPVDLAVLAWPPADEWVTRVAASRLVSGDGARPLRMAGSWLYLDRYWAEETEVAAALRAMADAPAAGVSEEALADGVARLFADEADGRQAAAAAAAVRRRLAVVAGGPGTGKTTTVARIVALLWEQSAAANESRPPLIALAAPTGKAAARLQEAVHAEAARLDIGEAVRESLTELTASTLHRLLGWRPGSHSRFRHGRDQRLPHDVVIVDETSMVSLSLMARLIEALRSDARLVLVGDPGQLASIEAGAVLGDIVGAGGGGAAEGLRKGTVVLDRGHRFGSGIAELAEAIRRGDPDSALALLHDPPPDVTWIETDVAREGSPAAIARPALTAALEVARAAAGGDARAALAALGAFRILCAHRRGPYGVASWTAKLQAWLADQPDGPAVQERWYVGRPLLVTENDYELRLNNGDSGVVVRAGDGRAMAVFERGEETIAYSPTRLGAVDTVYAMTIHKSQGSQFDAAAVMLPEPDSRILTRELLYTAATRARRRLILAGSEEAVRAAVGRPVARASGLGWRLAQGDPQ